MSALDFPTSPSDGDTYEGYVYNAAKGVWQWQTLTPSLVSLTDTTISSPASGEVLEYDGTNWVNAAAAVGGLVAVKSVLKTDTFSASVTPGSNVAVTDLSITHALSDSSNSLFLFAMIFTAGGDSSADRAEVAFSDGSNLFPIGDAAGSRTRVGASRVGSDQGSTKTLGTVIQPGSTSSTTYTVNIISSAASTQTFFANRTVGDPDNVVGTRGASTFVLMEVAV